MRLEEIFYASSALAVFVLACVLLAFILKRFDVRQSAALSIIIVGCLVLAMFAVVYFKMLGS